MEVGVDHVGQIFKISRWRGNACRLLPRHTRCGSSLWADVLLYDRRLYGCCDLVLLLLFELLLRSATSPLVLFLHIAIVHCSTEAVKIGEKGLREIRLDSPALVVDIMIGSIVGEDPVDRVVGKSVTTVIEDRFDGRSRKEPHGLTHCQAGKQVAQTSTQGIERESFDRVVVQSSVGIWHVKTVVA